MQNPDDKRGPFIRPPMVPRQPCGPAVRGRALAMASVLPAVVGIALTLVIALPCVSVGRDRPSTFTPSLTRFSVGLLSDEGNGDGPAPERDPNDAPEPGPIRRTTGAPEWPDDFEIGLQAARAYAFHFGLVQDDTLLARINRLGYAVTSQSGRPDILFTFHVLDVPDANAFALPGGFIFLTKGMTDLHLPDEALANLLGHEASHVTGNHFPRAGRIEHRPLAPANRRRDRRHGGGSLLEQLGRL